MAVGDSAALTATLRDAAGHAMTGVAVTWSSSDSTIVAVTTAGMAHARLSGTATIRAMAEGEHDTLGITVSVQYVAVSESQDHTCALATNGAAYCWGHGWLGDLGNGTTADQTVPTLVSGGHVFRSIATMAAVTCALAADSTAWCWGWGGEGQLGTGDTLSHSTPVAVAGGLHFAALVAGESHACGLAASGTAYCWGWNSSGQVAPGLDNVLAPTAVSGLAFEQVSTGTNQTCGLTAAGTAYCWGGNFSLELGAVTDSPAAIPMPIAGGGSYRAVTGGSPTCALATDSTVSCWGIGVSAADYRKPSPLPGGLHFGQIGGSSKGTTHCGVTGAGDAYCWGWPQFSLYGFAPSLVPGGHHFSEAWGGDLAHCGLATDSTAWCWGYNDLGGLGDSLAEDSSMTPVRVHGGHKFLSLQASDEEVTCGLGSDSAAYCWGQGVGSTPQQVPGGVTFKSVTAGGWEWMCGLGTDGTAYCWGGTLLPFSATAVPGGLTFASLSTGDGHACGITAAGATYCWGWNLMGDLGVPSVRAYSSNPVGVAGGATFASVSPMFMSTCGVATNGTVLCWGSNEDALLGNGRDAVESRVPLPVLGGHAFASLTAGPTHSCALSAGGEAWCWGGSDTLGSDIGASAPSVTPIQVPGGVSFSSLTLGYDVTCGLTAAGAAYCWGLGNRNPTAVQDSLSFISLTATSYGTVCGVTTGHQLRCWTQGTIPAPRRQLRRSPARLRALSLMPHGRGPM